MIYKYNDFILESQFNLLIDEIFLLTESERWIDDNTVEWIIDNPTKLEKIKGKLKDILSKLPKEKIKKYFYKLVNALKALPYKKRKKLLFTYSLVFLSFAPLNDLIPTNSNKELLEIRQQITEELKEEIEEVIIKSSFDDAQKNVKESEGGYSDDKDDPGNYVNTLYGDRLIGTNYGISAPILADHMGTLPTKDDMINLTYKTALEIYKNQYWGPQNLDEFKTQVIANIIYDGCVNQGISGTKSVLRKVYNNNGIEIKDNENPLSIDFIKEANALDQEVLFDDVKAGRETRYRSAKQGFKKYGKGWLNRLDTFVFPKEEIVEVGKEDSVQVKKPLIKIPDFLTKK